MAKLYVVATPIGNLADLTHRAAEVLADVATIYAEDTRQTAKLLTRYAITTPQRSYHQHSSPARHNEIIGRLDQGDDLALVCDAGTPAVADPGSSLVAAVRAAGHQVVPVPGAAALTTALSAAGLGGDRFTFVGFLPHKKGRQTLLTQLGTFLQPVVLYESPHRLAKLLTELAAHYPQAEVVVARELTKLHEELRAGAPVELADWYAEHPPKGEIVVVARTDQLR